MIRRKKTALAKMASALLMMLALLWLSVSTPFVYAAQQAVAEIVQNNGDEPGEELPLSANTTEERSESETSTLLEYLHEMLDADRSFALMVTLYKCHPADIYFAFHPELLSPPPEV